MPDESRGARIELHLGQLLLRSNRTHLYSMVVDGIDGVDTTTYPVLSGLARTGTTTSTKLAEDVGLDRTAVTRYLSRLEAVGLVQRAPDESDARAVSVELTSAGRKICDVMRHRLSTFFADIVSTWPAGDAECFVAGLERFTAVLTEHRR